MKTNVYNLEGKIIKEIELPTYFEQIYRPDLIKRAVISSQSKSYQKKGISPYSNRLNTAEYRGVRKPNKMNVSINTGKARLPRLKNRSALMAGRVAGISQAVGGPRAHPPKVAKILVKKINSKERTKAILSAISATANLSLVSLRSNSLPENLTFPIIIDNKFESFVKTKEVFELLEKIGLSDSILRAKETKTIRAGKGKGRGRRYKRRKSILVVLGDNKNHKAIGNLEGVDVVSARQLSIKELAPGTHAGRLTIFTENAIEKLNERFSKVI
ncbi:MAG: 50S ribosomal protein L4 [archaeon]|nr:50S ribosomal protein L4 [archaeon]MDD2477571.1 50S ribosomal protein L4 [Candidatus ainarchaeum sp.]MDD3084333.1 50S ribosomal protein L4 [Candidatus ainarchaeum sp.]MDD4221075.1 50S ribosomal protein L4 [Candidatus ainarchaeum sp.]MDD4662546.1 50S ribosomal protein L4 [Candidatus ainarchaeum sp.]